MACRGRTNVLFVDSNSVELARRTWGPWNFVGFWIADSFNIVSLFAYTSVGGSADMADWGYLEYMDDFIIYDYCGLIMVAVVALV